MGSGGGGGGNRDGGSVNQFEINRRAAQTYTPPARTQAQPGFVGGPASAKMAEVGVKQTPTGPTVAKSTDMMPGGVSPGEVSAALGGLAGKTGVAAIAGREDVTLESLGGLAKDINQPAGLDVPGLTGVGLASVAKATSQSILDKLIADTTQTQTKVVTEKGSIAGIQSPGIIPGSTVYTGKQAADTVQDSTPTALQEEPIAKAPCLLYTSPSPRDGLLSRMPSSA